MIHSLEKSYNYNINR